MDISTHGPRFVDNLGAFITEDISLLRNAMESSIS